MQQKYYVIGCHHCHWICLIIHARQWPIHRWMCFGSMRGKRHTLIMLRFPRHHQMSSQTGPFACLKTKPISHWRIWRHHSSPWWQPQKHSNQLRRLQCQKWRVYTWFRRKLTRQNCVSHPPSTWTVSQSHGQSPGRAQSPNIDSRSNWLISARTQSKKPKLLRVQKRAFKLAAWSRVMFIGFNFGQ